MRTILLPLLLLPFALRAQDLPHSLLWRIDPGSGGPSSYLYGTVHSKDDRAFQFGDSVMPALTRCPLVVGELDLDQGAAALSLMSGMMMPEGKNLEDLYKKKQWKVVDKALVTELGPMAPMMYRMKPFFVMAMFMEQALQGDRPQVLDEFLMTTARENGQRTAGLETMQEQMGAVDAMGLQEQAGYLLEYVETNGQAEEMESLMNAYAAQDLDALMRSMEATGGMSEKAERALLAERNVRMIHRMDSLIREEGSVFFLVGAAHLPASNGLIQGLRAKGYTVEAVMSARKPEE
ncbi:MAG: TraB/GumN family protein [Flavobacteriales bacterium]|nr:TraB/GumN family protein [Flavobacteriales bacterium]